jgi:hypothetical protein
MQQFLFWDRTVVTKRCVVFIPETQKFKGKKFFEDKILRGLVIAFLNYLLEI